MGSTGTVGADMVVGSGVSFYGSSSELAANLHSEPTDRKVTAVDRVSLSLCQLTVQARTRSIQPSVTMRRNDPSK